MDRLITNDEQLRALIPNVMATVEGETAFFDKLIPFLDQQQRWIEAEIIGNPPEDNGWLDLAKRVVALRAFAAAAPSLDLVLSPNGFGVVSTSELAPASKERVERLIVSLRAQADDALDLLLAGLMKLTSWSSSNPGLRYSCTLVKSLADVRRWHRSDDILATFIKIQDLAVFFESEAEIQYLGSSLMSGLKDYSNGIRTGDSLDAEFALLMPLIRYAENRWIDIHVRDQKLRCPDSHELWHLLAPAIERIKSLKRIYTDMWLPEKGYEFDSFTNDIQGGFYF